MIEGHTFVTARFMNDDRDIVQTIWEDKEGIQRPHMFRVNDDKKAWNDLLKLISEDQLHENTYNYIKRSQEDLELMVKQLAEGEGMNLQELLSDENKTIDFVIDWLSADYDNERLFKIKLRLFERDKVVNSQDRVLKANLRKANSAFEIVEAYSKF
tara:strand:+ start:2116 stop:2583 length:468 start_codon:yes stop_codon:yes gene_type:complete